ncbi:hypothetical protein D3C86_1812370 [compost metagenome]
MGEAERLDPAHLVELFQRLPDDDKGALIHMAEHLARKADPVAWALDNAPEDDEPLTAEDVAAIEAAKADPVTFTAEEMQRRYGLA